MRVGFSGDFSEIGELFEESIAVGIIAVVVSIAIGIGMFFLLRAIICWFCKINQHIRQMKQINENLTRIACALEFANNANLKIVQTTSPIVNTPVAAVPVPPVAGAPAAEEIHAVETPATPVETPATPVETPVAKVCPNCGSALSDNTVFCVNCGTKVN